MPNDRVIRLAPQRTRDWTSDPQPERNAWVVAQYRAGRTMTDIAAEAGITKQRVSQIVRRAARDAGII